MKHINFYAMLLAETFNLNLYRLGILSMSICAFFSTSCKRDFTDISSKKSKEFNIIMPKDGGTIIKGAVGRDTIKAQMLNSGNQLSEFDTAAYSFVWINFQNKDTLSRKPFLTSNDVGSLQPTLVSCLLSVTEKSTGIIKYVSTDIFVTTATREGWVLLGDKSGTAKLSVLTYTDKGYKKYVDLATELGIDVPLKGKPVSINAIGTENIYTGKYQWLGVATDQEIKLIQTTDFIAHAKMSDYVTSIMQPSTLSPVKLEVSGRTNFVATKDNNVYHFSTNSMHYVNIYGYSILNAYPPPLKPGMQPFKASPLHTFTSAMSLNEYSRMMYDEDNGVFVRAQISTPVDINGVFPLQLDFSTKGFKLKAITTLKGAEVDEITALLYNPTTSQSYLIQFLTNGIVKTSEAIPYADAEDLMASKFIEIDLNAGYLMYTKGNEVLAYDYISGKTFSLLKFGNENISLIKMIHHYPPASTLAGRVDLYKEILNRLIVCTYDAARPDDSGTFRTYQIRLGHQAPVPDIMETGFPKIVDATFAPIL